MKRDHELRCAHIPSAKQSEIALMERVRGRVAEGQSLAKAEKKEAKKFKYVHVTKYSKFSFEMSLH